MQARKRIVDKTCANNAISFCGTHCTSVAIKWMDYADGCVAPNENSLPHPFLNDNGINKVYADDAKHFKVEYRHYCAKEWNSSSSLSASLTVLLLIIAAIAMLV
jgi:hypothetical protein